MKTAQTLLSMALAASLPLAINAQTTIFQDIFDSGSTAQAASPAAPTANSTSYEYWQQGGTPTTPTIAPNQLHVAGRTTSSSISELQALFTTTPVSLVTVGDWIEMTVVFTNTTTIFPSGSASTLNIGLYNSGGVAPHQGARLDNSTAATNGFAQSWVGYLGRISGTGGPATSIITRPAQGINSASSSQNQDLLFNGASGSASFNNPSGTSLGSGTLFAAGLAAGSVYTMDYLITLSAVGTLTISNALYSGTGVNPVNLLNGTIGTASGANLLTTNFDAFAFGWRYNSASAANNVDIPVITVIANIQSVPEPSTVALVSVGVAALFGYYRRQRK